MSQTGKKIYKRWLRFPISKEKVSQKSKVGQKKIKLQLESILLRRDGYEEYGHKSIHRERNENEHLRRIGYWHF